MNESSSPASPASLVVTCSDLVGELVKRWPNKEGESTPKKRLLIIDDNEEYCVLFRAAFDKYGYYEIFTSTNGEEGLAIFKANQPFLVVFLDLVMPGMDGVEVFTKMREVNPLQYVIVITGAMSEEFSRRLEKFLCYGISFKPIDFNILAGILNTHINPPVA
jgi:DNA-binding NtrC family response regulator